MNQPNRDTEATLRPLSCLHFFSCIYGCHFEFQNDRYIQGSRKPNLLQSDEQDYMLLNMIGVS